MDLLNKFKISTIAVMLIFIGTFTNINAATKDTTSYFVYVSAKDSNVICVFNLNITTGNLSKVYNHKLSGGPTEIEKHPTKNLLYVIQRKDTTISTFKIDNKTGRLTSINKIKAVYADPVYIKTDKTGKYLLTAHYSSNVARIYAIDTAGIPQSPALQTINFPGVSNPHSIQTDLTNKFLYIPNKSTNKIYQYQFNEQTGQITPNTPPEVDSCYTGPRHFIFNKLKKIVYFINEKSNSISTYSINDTTGNLTSLQETNTLPLTISNSADIHITPNNKYLYASNRSDNDITDNEIVAYKINENSGLIALIGKYPTEKFPRDFNIDPTGNFLIAAGEKSNYVKIHRINQSTGVLTPLNRYYIGKSPAWVFVVPLINQIEEVIIPKDTVKTQIETNNTIQKLNNYPNPFQNNTSITYSINKYENINIQIINTNGQLIKDLLKMKQKIGTYTIDWNGMNNQNVRVAGTFFCKIESGSDTKVLKMILLP